MNDSSQFFETLAVAVAAGSTVRSAAETAGCSESHGYRISREKEFKLRVAEIRSEVTARAIGILTNGSTQAAQAIIELLGDEYDPKDRLAAAKAILASLGPLSELHELRTRLDAIERADKTLRGAA